MNISLINFFIALYILFFFSTAAAQDTKKLVAHADKNKSYQTIRNFGASDAWACQFAGNWPDEQRNAIADWLFSADTFSNGNPKGIGLSMWRYNLGAGSTEQGDSSGIKDAWRRASLTTSNSQNVQAQNWFLEAAKQRGVQQFLGFYNSPPVQLTKNGKAFATKGQCNIDSTQYQAFANYTINAMQDIERATGVMFNYISPVNEPQWDWSDGGQEGCPYTNSEISALVKSFSHAFQQQNIPTKLLITESGDLKYLLPANDKKNKDEQIKDFFNPNTFLYVGNQPSVAYTIAAHSYFTTSPFSDAMALRTRVKDCVAQINNLEYWQSEYCILGDNAGEISGNKKDLGMDAALYIAKVIYEDLVGGNAAAWQWWTAVSAYDYKDGLVYIDKSTSGGKVSDSKMLWALGNYSRFIRPGMHRIGVGLSSDDVLVSGYQDGQSEKLVFVVVNQSVAERPLLLDGVTIPADKKLTVYTTDATRNLDKSLAIGNNVVLPAKSVVTLVVD